MTENNMTKKMTEKYMNKNMTKKYDKNIAQKI